jgi:ABC-type lipoprotein export system ATPase subunit
MAKARADRSKEAPTKPAVPHHTILSLEVTGGFLKGVKLAFADGLNCIIGGRGTGKTTALEFIRYILGMMPDAGDGSMHHRRWQSRRQPPPQNSKRSHVG